MGGLAAGLLLMFAALWKSDLVEIQSRHRLLSRVAAGVLIAVFLASAAMVTGQLLNQAAGEAPAASLVRLPDRRAASRELSVDLFPVEHAFQSHSVVCEAQADAEVAETNLEEVRMPL